MMRLLVDMDGKSNFAEGSERKKGKLERKPISSQRTNSHEQNIAVNVNV